MPCRSSKLDLVTIFVTSAFWKVHENKEKQESYHHNGDMTEWSCVYNLDDFTVSICLDSDYENVYTFSASDLK